MERDFEPIVILVKHPLLFSINAKVPARTLAEFVALVKTKPDKFNYGTPGASSQSHLLIEMWSARAGIKMQHIPYRGVQTSLSVATGETHLVLLSPASVKNHIESGTVRPLATGGLVRDAQRPDLPAAGGTSEEFRELIATEIRNWKETARQASIEAK